MFHDYITFSPLRSSIFFKNFTFTIKDTIIKMRSKESKKTTYVKAKRFLQKARDFYVKSMMDFDGKFSHNNIVALAGPQAPTNFGETLIKKRNDENLKDLHRSNTMKNNIGYSRATLNDQRERVFRSYSVGLGRIGRINEEEPCEFREEEIIMKSEILLPTRRRL